MRNPVLSGFVQKRLKPMSVISVTVVIDPITGRDTEVEAETVITGGMVLQPYNANSSKLSPVGERSVVHWLGISGPQVAIPQGAVLVGADDNRYKVVSSAFWEDFWACALLDMGITPDL
jgi:hypothetical protein